MELKTPFRRPIGILLAILALLVGAAMVTAMPASAGLPAVCTEYPNLPQCQEDEDDDDDEGEDEGEEGQPGGQGAGPGGPSAGVSKGELPFTGYPLTPLLLLLLLLLLAGLTIRAYLEARDRIRGRASHPR